MVGLQMTFFDPALFLLGQLQNTSPKC